MKALIDKILKIFLSKEFILFVIIGVINTFNGVIFSMIYSKFLDANLAFVVGYISGLFISYILNSYVTFKEKLEFSKFIKFAISYIVVLVVFNIMGLNKLIAYILAAIIGVPVTFILMKFFAFKEKDKNKIN